MIIPIPMTVAEINELHEATAKAVAALREATSNYLEVDARLHQAKFDLNRAIDAAYRDGAVMGKNEREREASLREILASLYGEVDTLEISLRMLSRTMRDAEIVMEGMRLSVKLAQCANALVTMG